MSDARCPSLTRRVEIAQASEPLALSSSLACTLALRACSGGCFIPTRRVSEGHRHVRRAVSLADASG